MSPPDTRAVTVATDALRRDAAVWGAQAAALRDVVAQVDQLRLTALQAGVFFVVLAGHEEVVARVVARGTEGADRVAAVGAALRACADTYDREEAQHLHALAHLY